MASWCWAIAWAAGMACWAMEEAGVSGPAGGDGPRRWKARSREKTEEEQWACAPTLAHAGERKREIGRGPGAGLENRGKGGGLGAWAEKDRGKMSFPFLFLFPILFLKLNLNMNQMQLQIKF